MSNEDAQRNNFLMSTDWKVIRHRDQLDLGIPTTLTQQEYLQLLQQRQEARSLIVEKVQCYLGQFSE